MTKKEKLQWLRDRFDVTILSTTAVRAQKHGLIVTGSVLQVYDELKVFRGKKNLKKEELKS